MMDYWRVVHGPELLTEEEVAALPTGTEVEIVWSGGNGPARYTVEQNAGRTNWRYEGLSDEQWENVKRWQDPISFVGRERFHTHVRVLSVLGAGTPREED